MDGGPDRVENGTGVARTLHIRFYQDDEEAPWDHRVGVLPVAGTGSRGPPSSTASPPSAATAPESAEDESADPHPTSALAFVCGRVVPRGSQELTCSDPEFADLDLDASIRLPPLRPTIGLDGVVGTSAARLHFSPTLPQSVSLEEQAPSRNPVNQTHWTRPLGFVTSLDEAYPPPMTRVRMLRAVDEVRRTRRVLAWPGWRGASRSCPTTSRK